MLITLIFGLFACVGVWFTVLTLLRVLLVKKLYKYNHLFRITQNDKEYIRFNCVFCKEEYRHYKNHAHDRNLMSQILHVLFFRDKEEGWIVHDYFDVRKRFDNKILLDFFEKLFKMGENDD